MPKDTISEEFSKMEKEFNVNTRIHIHRRINFKGVSLIFLNFYFRNCQPYPKAERMLLI